MKRNGTGVKVKEGSAHVVLRANQFSPENAVKTEAEESSAVEQ